MRRGGADDAEDFALGAGEDADALGDERVGPPAAEGGEFEEAAWGDLLDGEADFVAVAGDEDAGGVGWAGVFADDAAEAVALDGAEGCEFAAEDGADGVFRARDAVGFGEVLEERECNVSHGGFMQRAAGFVHLWGRVVAISLCRGGKVREGKVFPASYGNYTRGT